MDFERIWTIPVFLNLFTCRWSRNMFSYVWNVPGGSNCQYSSWLLIKVWLKQDKWKPCFQKSCRRRYYFILEDHIKAKSKNISKLFYTLRQTLTKVDKVPWGFDWFEITCMSITCCLHAYDDVCFLYLIKEWQSHHQAKCNNMHL